MVQTRWTYLNRGYSALTNVESILLDGHFVIEHGARSRNGVFFNFNGTAGIWRRAAIDDAGGWEHDTLTEDTDLSYRAQLRGWRFLYLPDIECASELPVEMNSFKSQQARWAKGLMQTAIKILPRILRSNEPAGRQSRSHIPSHGERQLSAHGSILRAAAAGDDRALLSGLVSDAADRSAALPGGELLGLRFLSRGAARALSAQVVPLDSLHSLRDGRRHRPLRPQRQSRARSDVRNQIGIRAHAEVQHLGPLRHLAQEVVSQSRRLDAVSRSAPRPSISPRPSCTPSRTKIISPCPSFCFSSGATSTPG